MSDEGPKNLSYIEKNTLPGERPLISVVESMGKEGLRGQQVIGIGFEITEPDDPFDVKEALFTENRFESPEPIKAIYLETEDGNIFRILRDDNGDGFLQDARLTAEYHQTKEEHGEYKGQILEDPHLLDNLTIGVGKNLDWGTFTTPKVIKLTAIIDNVGDLSANINTEGRVSNIAERFRNISRPNLEIKI